MIEIIYWSPLFVLAKFSIIHFLLFLLCCNHTHAPNSFAILHSQIKILANCSMKFTYCKYQSNIFDVIHCFTLYFYTIFNSMSKNEEKNLKQKEMITKKKKNFFFEIHYNWLGFHQNSRWFVTQNDLFCKKRRMFTSNFP